MFRLNFGLEFPYPYSGGELHYVKTVYDILIFIMDAYETSSKSISETTKNDLSMFRKQLKQSTYKLVYNWNMETKFIYCKSVCETIEYLLGLNSKNYAVRAELEEILREVGKNMSLITTINPEMKRLK